jgi:hypothetical protein
MGKPGVHPPARKHVSTLAALLAAGIALCLLLTSCGSTVPPGANPPAAPAGTGTSMTADDLVKVFANAGVGTFTTATARTPEQPVAAAGPSSLLRWQVENMARQLNTGRGFVGTDLDDLVGGKVPISVVLAAYLSLAPTSSAKAAREIMGDQDWAHQATHLVYPEAVITLFVNDLARDAASGSTAKPAAFVNAGFHAVPAVAMRAESCSQLTSMLSGTLDKIINNLQIEATTGVAGVLAVIWNTAITIAVSAAGTVLGALTAPVVSIIRGAITVLAVLSSASSLLDPWTLTTTASPNPASFGILPAAGTKVVVTTKVNTAADFQWPGDLKNCAQTITGVELPDPDSTKDSPITWDKADDESLTIDVDEDAKVNETGTATKSFLTGAESAEDAEKGPQLVAVVSVRSNVTRTAIDKLGTLLTGLLLDQLPGPAAGIAAQLLGPLKSTVQTKLEKLTSVEGHAVNVFVIHHGPAPKKADDDPPPAAEGCVPGDGPKQIPDGTWSGPISLNVRGSDGKGNEDKGFTDSAGSGTMLVKVKDGKVVSGIWNVHWISVGHSTLDGVSSVVKVYGLVKGSVRGFAQKPQLVGTWKIHGAAVFEVGGSHDQIPIDETGAATENMTLTQADCNFVGGKFIPSFNAKGSGVSFTGTAEWSGKPA